MEEMKKGLKERVQDLFKEIDQKFKIGSKKPEASQDVQEAIKGC